MVEPAVKALPPIYDHAEEPSTANDRVVVICHCRGRSSCRSSCRCSGQLFRRPAAALEAEARPASLFAEAPLYAPPELVYPDEDPIDLDDFGALTEAELAKLEVYCFANCANTMTTSRPADGHPLPWIKSSATRTTSWPGWACSRRDRGSAASASTTRATSASVHGGTC